MDKSGVGKIPRRSSTRGVATIKAAEPIKPQLNADRVWLWVIPALIFLTVLAMGFVLQQVLNRNWQLEQESQLDEAGSVHAILLERQLSRYTVAAHLLGHKIRETNGDTGDFEAYANRVIEEIGGIANLQLAPNGIITHIHPLKGHEKALGYDIISNQFLQPGSMKAIESQRLTVIGPLNLVQGGTGILGRYPVFLPDGEGGEKFWGLVSALIMLDDFLAASQLDYLTDQGYVYRLWRIATETGQKAVFAGVADQELTPPVVTTTVNLPNEEWFLDVAFATPIGHYPGYLSGITVTALLSVVLAWLAWFYLRLPERLRSEVKTKTRQLETLAFYDQLTGLPNRKLFLDRLTHAIHRQQRTQRPFALFYIDLDGFKLINDSLGHQIGDRLLEEVANRLALNIRKSDTAARIGGDEFTVLLVDIQPPTDVGLLARHLLSELAKPASIDNHTLSITVSIGITLCPHDGSDADRLLNNSDLAMYRAKNLGKNNAQFFSESLHQEIAKRQDLVDTLSVALEHNELFPVYHPVLSRTTGKVVAVEALLRWQPPGQDLVLPVDFLSATEDSGLIIRLGEHVLRQAVEEIRLVNQGRGANRIGLSVNLSARQFRHPDLGDLLTRVLNSTGLEPCLLSLEIDESNFAFHNTETGNILNRLKSCGINLVVDHFVTGHAPLRQLKEPPVRAVKIDFSLISNIHTNQDNFTIVSAIIAMAHSMKVDAIAQGVETVAQLEALDSIGCELVQGFLFGKPVAARELPELIRQIESRWHNNDPTTHNS